MLVQKPLAVAVQRASLRPHQSQLKGGIYGAWDQGFDNVLAVSPTGSGKTVLFSNILHDHIGASCAIAHRQELVSQISLALARDRVAHKIIGPKNVVKLCVNLHMQEVGASYYNPQAKCAVAGVDTLIKRGAELSSWLGSVTLWVQDEAHHVLESNKWGAAAKMFPNAKGLGVTATPERADGKGLGRHADGLFDTMIVGPDMRELINMGYLTDYRIFAPPTDFVRPEEVGSTGDFTRQKMTTAVKKSHVIGDVVKHYKRIADGLPGVTFVPDVETAQDVAAQFVAAGVPAKAVSAKTPDAERIAAIRDLKNGKLKQLVNVDLFGEGFDLPSISTVSFARPTESFGLYVQQFGRALRLAEGKKFAIIIDHVGNVERHGLPDAPRKWTLDRREKKGKSKASDSIPVKSCLNVECMAVYERVYKACPFCGHVTPPAARNAPEFVDGDLHELDPATLAAMRGDIARVDMHPEAYREELAAKHMPKIGQLANVKRHAARQEAQEALRASIAWWAGYQRAAGRHDSESYRRFFFKFGVDVLTAQALNTKEALELAGRINEELASV